MTGCVLYGACKVWVVVKHGMWNGMEQNGLKQLLLILTTK